MGRPILYGADYSVYVRIARLALIEKGVDHELQPVDVFAEGGPPRWYLDLHPFGRIPAFMHDGVRLYETSAICRYVDEAFDGPDLQPAAAADRAIMQMVVAMLDSYAYRPLVWGIGVETASKPARGETPDAAVVEKAVVAATVCLGEMENRISPAGWLAGDRLSLADLHAGPMIGFFLRSPLAASMMARHPRLSRWWEAVRERPSFLTTQPSG